MKPRYAADYKTLLWLGMASANAIAIWFIPKARIAFTVCIQSSLGRNPRSVHTPFDRAAMITARCEILLSPGTVISRSIRGARFTRNSIDKKNSVGRRC